MRRFLILLCYILLSFNSLADNSSWGLWDDFTSPLTTDAKYITLGGLAASALVVASKDLDTYRKSESFDEARPFGKYGIIGEAIGWGFLNAGYATYFYLDGKFRGNETSYELSSHMAKASLFSLGWVMIGKTFIKEKRPGYPDDDSSFPSGHSAASFAFASVVAARHGWGYGSGAYALAFFIAMSRINDDFHYLHDTLVGATIGAAYGWGTFYNYENKKSYVIIPSPVYDGAKLDIVWNF
ncbi:phosphatase PAP2 family protein [Bacteriovorax sp. Seq25_V]|uniref:phosphatase PAP2 family protein n=1 Tax=Bacteriovorax sp. Seq25_V TaxID=1201288 RepID=UPI00038A23FF|nr:phosphatase PAP2 family protein [Bacteriovorax sp. Seq25_V]EQC46092.1 PAP2 family protein [Bacteriovorax sp. Seq25_V]